jgi:amino acid transporter
MGVNQSRVAGGTTGDNFDDEASIEPGVFNPELTTQELMHGQHAGDQYVRVERPYQHLFRRVGAGHLRATEQALEEDSLASRIYFRLKRVLIGSPLATEREIHERLTKVKALAVFASDAISSTAYATEEILFVLIATGGSFLFYSFPISLTIAFLLFIVAFSYRQTVFAYPGGGGSYIVAKENLGEIFGLVAAAALMLDYVLTVAVSIASGADNIISAFPQIHALSVCAGGYCLNSNTLLSLFFVLLIMLGNLRGIREAGSIFMAPTYAFIISLAIVLITSLIRLAAGWGPAEAVAHGDLPVKDVFSPWLLLTAFSAGAVAMSGTEAISNGVPAFKPPEAKNAATTLTIMATLLGVFFVGISFLAWQFKIVPTPEETVISQLGRASFGRDIPVWNIMYYFLQFSTMGILVIAANTAFADFPRLSSILGRDDYMPHQFRLRGDRLAFSTGIISLSLIAAALLLVFNGDTHLLIPLYAVGVFLAFTLSQSGMVLHWYRMRHPGWLKHAIVNGIGAALTAVVLIIAAVTKFEHGAWIIILAIPVIVAVFYRINRHYTRVRAALELSSPRQVPRTLNMLVLVVIPSVNYATERALSFARTISHNVAAVHVAFDQASANMMRERLREFDPDVNLVTLEDPYRRFYAPLASYVEAIQEHDPNMFVTIVLPEFIVRHWWERYLHNRATKQLNDLFLNYPNVAIVNVPYVIEEAR